MFAHDMPFRLQTLQILPDRHFGNGEGLGQIANAGAALLLKPGQHLHAPRFAQQGVARGTGTGRPSLDPLFAALKLAWLLDTIPGGRDRAAAGEVCAGTIDSWLIWKLTGGAAHATDHSNASRTQLLNLHSLSWDADLAALFRVPLNILPQLRPSDSLFGTVAKGCCALPAGTPIHAIMGDSHAAMFGHGIRSVGAAKASIGTGSSIMALAPGLAQSRNGLSGTIAWSRQTGVQFAIKGNITVSGQAAAFTAHLLGQGNEQALTALTVADSGGVVFVPALAGLGASHWKDRARGLVTGMALGTTPAHLTRATFETIAIAQSSVTPALSSALWAWRAWRQRRWGCFRTYRIAQRGRGFSRDGMGPAKGDSPAMGRWDCSGNRALLTVVD